MNFYTLTYDVDLPAVQQVNVPTNSDYKIGMKVKRNGTVQSIKPSEFTITAQDGTTLSADSEKTNGYVTFTQAAGDDASFKQLSVSVSVNGNIVDKKVGQFGSTSPDPNPSLTYLTAGDLGIAGREFKAEEFGGATVYTWRKAAQPSETIEGWTRRPLIPDPAVAAIEAYYFSTLPLTMGDRVLAVVRVDKDYTLEEGYAVPELVGTTLKAGEFWFVECDVVQYYGTQIRKLEKTHVFAADDLVVYNGALKFTANYWWGKWLKWEAYPSFSADFKLNVNEFKSQSGDIAETLADGSSVKVDGTYADGTTFSFDFCTK